MFLKESRPVAEHTPSKLRLWIRLMFDVNQKEGVLVSEVGSDDNVGFVPLTLGHVCKDLFVQKDETISVKVSDDIGQK